MRLQDGSWFTIGSKVEHDCLKKFGKLLAPPHGLGSARVQMGTWDGPGRYLLLSYSQPCPRGCCTDDVFEVLSAVEVVDRVKESMTELAGMLREARAAA